MTYARCSAHAQVIEISMSNRCMSKEIYSYLFSRSADDGAEQGAVGRGPRRSWAPGKIEGTDSHSPHVKYRPKSLSVRAPVRTYLAPSINAALLSAAYFLIVAVRSASDTPLARAYHSDASAGVSKGQAYGHTNGGHEVTRGRGLLQGAPAVRTPPC